MKLRLINLTKKFMSLRGIVTAVNDIELEIKEGEFFVLLGPSGCGKSTVLNLVAGLEKPTSGEIWFGERLAASGEKRICLTPKERNVAFVFQSYALYPHLSVFENIAFPLRVTGEDTARIKESVERVGSMLRISNLLAVRPGELSGGQRQRVAIARAIVRHPNIFLLDEPLSNLDAQLRASTRDELKRLQRELGVTTIYVTHDQVEALTLGDRIALLKDGRLEQIGTPEELYEKPVNVFAAKFIGSPSMNIFESGSSTFGIRPEDIHITRLDSFPQMGEGNGVFHVDRPFKAKIDLIESMGRERLIHLVVGGQRFSALTADARFKEGELVELELDLKKLHIFAERR